MNDLIYRHTAVDALKSMAVPLYKDLACEDIWERDRTLDNAIEKMVEIPSVDAVEVVRCRDCIYYDCIYTFKSGDCVYKQCHLPVFDDDFCSKGERRPNET